MAVGSEWYDRGMTAYGFSLFDTAIGRCGIAWSDRGLVGVQLPEASEAEARERMLQRFSAAAEMAPPHKVKLAIDGLTSAETSDRALEAQKVSELANKTYSLYFSQDSYGMMCSNFSVMP